MKNDHDVVKKISEWLDSEIMRLTKENMSYCDKNTKLSNMHKKYALIDVKYKLKDLLWKHRIKFK